MSAVAKAFFALFVILALASLGHDIYVWQSKPGYPFNFAAIGWMTKTYYPDQHQMIVDTLGAETFNEILTPLLAIPAFFLTTGIAALIFVIDFIKRQIRSADPGRGKDRDTKVKNNKHKIGRF